MPRGARSTRRARAFAGQPTIVAVNGLGGLEHLWDASRAALPPEQVSVIVLPLVVGRVGRHNSYRVNSAGRFHGSLQRAALRQPHAPEVQFGLAGDEIVVAVVVQHAQPMTVGHRGDQ